jgi:hypothetical protein
MALNYTTLSATTERNVIPKLIDNIFNSNVVMQRLSKKGTKLDGGRLIEYPIIMANNSAGGAYSPEDTLSTTPNEIIDNAQYDWRLAA